jgi:hypothetical protein
MGGLPLAIAAYLLANRLLPLEMPGRPDAELSCFFGTWALALLLGLIRPMRQGWALVLGMAATAYLLLPLVNALTTSTHLGISLPAMDWSWAGMDLSFAAMGLMLAALTRHLLQRRPQPAARHAAPPRRGSPGRKPGAQGSLATTRRRRHSNAARLSVVLCRLDGSCPGHGPTS